jgi:hypothetical protein
MSLKEKYLQKKLDKTKKLAMKVLGCSDGIETIFSIFNNKPTPDQFVNMVCVSKYGPGEPLSEGGESFALEYIIHEFNEVIKDTKNKPVTILNEDGQGMGLISSQSERWANLLFTFYLDEKFVGYMTELDKNDFHELDKYPSVFIDSESGSLALQIGCVPSIPVSDLYKEPCFHQLGIGDQWKPTFYPDKLKNNDKFFWYQVRVSTLDRILEEIDRQKHGVKSHERHIKSGKVVIVASHERRNPIITKGRKQNSEEVDYIVYRVKDADGTIRYYGEGREGRPGHVNSGVSHNFKINEHFFTKGPMEVEILSDGLSKQEALVIEKFLIKAHSGSALWNIKDYEPFIDKELIVRAI